MALLNLDEFCEELVNVLDLPEVDSLTAEQIMRDITDFDSIAILSLLTWVSVDFDKHLDGPQFLETEITVRDLYNQIFGR